MAEPSLIFSNVRLFLESRVQPSGSSGVSLIPPVTKRLACGDYGNGAMAEPSLIFSTIRLFLESRVQPSGSSVNHGDIGRLGLLQNSCDSWKT
ncbi:hypothetical protein OROMI_006648 [Orobanche minor]